VGFDFGISWRVYLRHKIKLLYESETIGQQLCPIAYTVVERVIIVGGAVKLRDSKKK